MLSPEKLSDRRLIRALQESDLDRIAQVERQIYAFPWSKGIFRDCLYAGYSGLVIEMNRDIIGYGMLSTVLDEAHLLNLSVAKKYQRRGYGKVLLSAFLEVAHYFAAQCVFLEVRTSNVGAIALYRTHGFNEVGRRLNYYPAAKGREDALVMARHLLTCDTTEKF